MEKISLRSFRRIGQASSPDKAHGDWPGQVLPLALAAAHETRRPSHRDLKPANVMLDGAGKIRITDFWPRPASPQASKALDVPRGKLPHNMAPEQLAGPRCSAPRAISIPSALILYEILTGKTRLRSSKTLPELMKQRESRGRHQSFDFGPRLLIPLVEARHPSFAWKTDPEKNVPPRALQVAAALPGGDPLAAALAAGETPSPQMVAAAGSTEGDQSLG